MLNMIKAETKRLIKSKGFWISVLIYILVFITCFYMQLSAEQSTSFVDEGISKEPGFYISVDASIKSLNQLVQTFGFGFGSLVLGIYFTSFVCSEYTSGYIKNTAVLEGGRKAVILSKIMVALVISFIILALNYLIGWILGICFIDNFMINPVQEIFIDFSMMLLLMCALFSLIIFLSTIFHNKTFGIVLLFLIASGMLQPFLDSIFNLLHISFASEYTLSYFFSTILPVSGPVVSHAFMMSIAFILVYNIGSAIVLQKTDI
ncbi:MULTISPECIES: ABC transporter permease [Bacillota]|jgi:ABC-type transport system involved in multi-copper enzyme maturation permease subunit|uniref:ABC transporter permease n=2 Tax=Amedibacillus TaxID=2749846 RepID=A0A7G9GRY7_9FIRM|nr:MULTISPECIES: ABC transporter permease [Bacillota]MCH4286393.1 ABC transporter permease [Amedibacillus hominis]QNM13569.1 ABC transporter permease [[Eubacterium] hominis]